VVVRRTEILRQLLPQRGVSQTSQLQERELGNEKKQAKERNFKAGWFGANVQRLMLQFRRVNCDTARSFTDKAGLRQKSFSITSLRTKREHKKNKHLYINSGVKKNYCGAY